MAMEGGIGKTSAPAIAHDVRNRLHAIRGAILYLNRKFPDVPAIGEFAKLMEGEISRLEASISDLLYPHDRGGPAGGGAPSGKGVRPVRHRGTRGKREDG
jgi:hypothetical protein